MSTVVAAQKVWFRLNDSWVEWMGLSRDFVHPKHRTRFLKADKDMFVWANMGTFTSARVEAGKLFGEGWTPATIVKMYLAHLGKTIKKKRQQSVRPSKEKSEGAGDILLWCLGLDILTEVCTPQSRHPHLVQIPPNHMSLEWM
jgi:hypothetical protein